MMTRVASLQEENESLHEQVAELRKKIAMQEKAIMRLKILCHNGQGLPIPEFEKKECREFLENLYKEL